MSVPLDSGERAAIATARVLAMDAVERAGTGHPGTAMALAPVAHLLFHRHLRHDPACPEWMGRDRFVLSCGHASILQYVQLYLSGYDVGLDDLRSFRTLDSRTPGHPERGHTAGVETTTGPLGQGFATAVGMAMGLAHDRALYDPETPAGDSLFDQSVWVIASDGDLQEGVSHEAAALAGHHRLGNLVVLYDDNEISIDGPASLSQSEDVVARFEAQGWLVLCTDLADDGDVDVEAVDGHMRTARTTFDRPVLIVVRSQIAWPAPHATGTSASHGSPLGTDEADAVRARLLPGAEPFEVSGEVLAVTRDALERGRAARMVWERGCADWERDHPLRAAQLQRAINRVLPAAVGEDLPRWEAGAGVATRDASGAMLVHLSRHLPELWGGSADLGEPNRTTIAGESAFLPDGLHASGGRSGRTIHWGIREHAMAATMNGIALIGTSRIYGGTFLVFSDYERPALRLASLMGLPVVHVWTHDSVAVGADGPTHQPIEHLASLRAMPGFAVVRPGDAHETVAAWLAVLEGSEPAGLVLSRQPVPVIGLGEDEVRAGVRRGAYAVVDPESPRCVIVATGSEVGLAVETARQLDSSGMPVKVVSMPCREWFARQDEAYKSELLPVDLPRVVVEAASPFGWGDVVGASGFVHGIDTFGLSASPDEVLAARGMTVEALTYRVHDLLGVAAG